jgi:hypothetical protein
VQQNIGRSQRSQRLARAVREEKEASSGPRITDTDNEHEITEQ